MSRPASAKPIRLSNHCRMQLNYRGTSEQEIRETIQEAAWEGSELGRFQCRKEFAYNQIWNGKKYGTKQVRPIFADEKNEIVVVTV